MKNRKQLFAEVKRLENEADVIRKQIDAMDYDKRLAKAKKYVGRFYKERQDYPRYVFVYDTCKINCEPISLEFYYSEEDGKVSFTLHNDSGFFPCEDVEWEEITEAEFMSHFVKIKEAMIKIIR